VARWWCVRRTEARPSLWFAHTCSIHCAPKAVLASPPSASRPREHVGARRGLWTRAELTGTAMHTRCELRGTYRRRRVAPAEPGRIYTDGASSFVASHGSLGGAAEPESRGGSHAVGCRPKRTRSGGDIRTPEHTCARRRRRPTVSLRISKTINARRSTKRTHESIPGSMHIHHASMPHAHLRAGTRSPSR
jgi:hypothetical protein